MYPPRDPRWFGGGRSGGAGATVAWGDEDPQPPPVPLTGRSPLPMSLGVLLDAAPTHTLETPPSDEGPTIAASEPAAASWRDRGINPMAEALANAPGLERRADGSYGPIADAGPSSAPAFGASVSAPSARDAAAVLRRAMGVPGGMSPNDPVTLAGLRTGRLDELRFRKAGDINAGDVRGVARDESLIGDLERDIATDPLTGDAARKRTTDTEDALREATLVQRPELDAAAQTIAKRNAFAKFLESVAPLEAQNTPEGRAALDAASRRKQAELAVTAGGKDKLTAQGKQSVTAFEQAKTLGTKLLSVLDDPANGLTKQTDLEAARNKGTFGQLMDSAAAKINRWKYAQGVIGPKGYDTATQLADWMKVAATSGLLRGVRNMQWIEQIQDHLAQGRLPPAANRERLIEFLSDVDDLQNDVFQGENVPRPQALRTEQQRLERPTTMAPPAKDFGPSGFGAYQGRTPATAPAAPGGAYENYLRRR